MNKEIQRKRMSIIMKNRTKLIKNMTESEKLFEQILKENKIYYIKQKGFIAKGYSCIVDFYLPKWKCCVEIDGGYHNTLEQKEKDKIRSKYLTDVRNLNVLRIKNQYVSRENFPDVLIYLNKLTRGKSYFFYPSPEARKDCRNKTVSAKQFAKITKKKTKS